MAREKQYIAIDLKSFYASVECTERGLDPLDANLVVADESRTDKTICLAVSPSLKALGVPGRARLFEAKQRIREVNARRLRMAPGREFRGKSAFASELEADPSLELDLIVAPPRMRYYMEYSRNIVKIYMRYVSMDDILVYSVDEVFIDATPYLGLHDMSARDFAMMLIRDVLRETGITATAGIGTNLYLAKVAMDISAKHMPADRDGVRIAELDEQSYREQLWCHQPLTDFWRVGRGISARLAALGCRTMGDVARLSLADEDLLYRSMGINAELLIDHAWGWEPTRISDIKAYRPESKSLSSGQVLPEPYDWENGRLIVREMTELLALDLVRKRLVTRKLELVVCYDRESLTVRYRGRSLRDTVFTVSRTGELYTGPVSSDPYGRPVPKHAAGTGSLDRWTSSTRRIADAMMALYDSVVSPDLLIRRVCVVALDLIREKDIPEEGPVQLDLFTDYEALSAQREKENAEDARERRLQEAALQIQERFGKNAMLKGMNLEEGGTTIRRNGQVGGHRAE